jgi:long-chain acyl-CoA synthetase
MNIADNLDRTAFQFPGHSAVIDGDRNVSYLEFNRDANRVASAMVSLDVRAGDHVALCAPNSYEWLVFYFGALKAGAVAVTMSHLLMKGELDRSLADCQPKMLLTEDHRLKDLGDRRGRPYPKLVVCDHGDLSFTDLTEQGASDFETVDRDRHDTAAILYTGGTTGVPKGAMLSHQNIQSSVFNIAHYERSTADDRALCFLPLNHVFGQIHILGATVLSGGATVLLPAFDLEEVLEAIRRHQVTKFFAVPTIYIRLLRVPDFKEKMRSVRYCFSAAASMAAEVVREWKAQTGLDIYESYGMTESAAMVTYNHYYRHVIGSVGTAVNLVEVQIRDLEGNALEQGERGEICICGPNITKGYLNNPEETESAFWGDWFRSGDIGVMDEDGYLYIVDRLKDMIITGGENVYPREVEEVLYTRPEVLECAVVGLPDEEYGERVTAFIIEREGRHVDPASMRDFLKGCLAAFKVPKEFVVVEELPKSSTGKLLKRELRDSASRAGKGIFSSGSVGHPSESAMPR